MTDIFSMNGHGIYVWSSYALTLAIFVLNIRLAANSLARNLRLARESQDESSAARRPTVRQMQ
jgi:heme exporter protein CcmD